MMYKITVNAFVQAGTPKEARFKTYYDSVERLIHLHFLLIGLKSLIQCYASGCSPSNM